LVEIRKKGLQQDENTPNRKGKLGKEFKISVIKMRGGKKEDLNSFLYLEE